MALWWWILLYPFSVQNYFINVMNDFLNAKITIRIRGDVYILYVIKKPFNLRHLLLYDGDNFIGMLPADSNMNTSLHLTQLMYNFHLTPWVLPSNRTHPHRLRFQRANRSILRHSIFLIDRAPFSHRTNLKTPELFPIYVFRRIKNETGVTQWKHHANSRDGFGVVFSER